MIGCSTSFFNYTDEAELSRYEPVRLPGAGVRQIQLFEQRQRDINKNQAVNLVKLSRTIGCWPEDLMEI